MCILLKEKILFKMWNFIKKPDESNTFFTIKVYFESNYIKIYFKV